MPEQIPHAPKKLKHTELLDTSDVVARKIFTLAKAEGERLTAVVDRASSDAILMNAMVLAVAAGLRTRVNGIYELRKS